MIVAVQRLFLFRCRLTILLYSLGIYTYILRPRQKFELLNLAHDLVSLINLSKTYFFYYNVFESVSFTWGFNSLF